MFASPTFATSRESATVARIDLVRTATSATVAGMTLLAARAAVVGMTRVDVASRAESVATVLALV